jgi:hypothetical protein
MIDRNLLRFGETFLGVGPDARNRFFMRISAAFALRRLQLPERDQPLGGDQGRVGSACSSSPESVTMPPRLEGAGAAPTPEPIGQVGELQVEQHQHLIDGASTRAVRATCQRRSARSAEQGRRPGCRFAWK